MYRILGWINIALVSVMILPFILTFINIKILHTKNSKFQNFIKLLRRLHKYLGAVLLIFAGVHGYLALGALRFHTGTILGIIVIITATFGITFKYVRKKPLFLFHKIFAALLITLLIVHLIIPSAVFYIFG